jgi:cell division protein FtsI (penicillin-binding protein 3)
VNFRLPIKSNPEKGTGRFDPLKWITRPALPAEPDTLVRPTMAGRARFLGGVVTFGLLILMMQSSSLMMFPNPALAHKANNQFNTPQEIHGRRGDILTADGVSLATSVEVQTLHADPSQLTNETSRILAKTLAPMLDLKVNPMVKRLSKRKRQDVQLAKNLVPDRIDAIMAKVDELTDEHPTLKSVLFTRSAYRRFYPAGSDAAPLLGVVGTSGTGLAGLERSMDRHLAGETYKYVQWRDRKGRHITTNIPEARPGQSVMLTIDRRIQRIAEAALDNVMERSEPTTATAVVIDPNTGAVLALAQRPTHNPNDTRRLKSEALKNRAVTDAFEPGSVFKPFIAAAAIEEDLVNPETPIDCENGRFRVGRNVISDDHAKKVISVSEVIKFSSNIGAAKLAFLLGAERSLDYLKGFGFSRRTNTGLYGEARGVMRSAADIKPIELATTSYGHGVTSTAMQLASAMATIANDGVRMNPFLISEIQDSSGVPVRIFEPTVDQRVVSKETARQVLEMMATVTEAGGTGTHAAIPGYSVAGKTGTAWKHVDGSYSRTERIGSFIGAIPAENPQLAMAIVVDNPTKGSRYGGPTAGPAFSEIGAATLRLLGVPQNPTLLTPDATGKNEAKPTIPTAPPELRWAERGKLIAPDLSGLSMRDALTTLEGAGLALQIKGSGRVIEQSPRPGHTLRPGDRLEVVLQ